MLSIIYVFLSDKSTFLNYSYSWLIGLYLWIVFAIIIFIKVYYKKYLNNISITKNSTFIKKILKYSGLVVIGTSASSLLWQMDMQMIIYFLWTHEAWYYTNYLSIITIPFVLIWPIFVFLFPVISEMHWKWDITKIQLVKNIFTKNFIAIWIMFNIFFFILW